MFLFFKRFALVGGGQSVNVKAKLLSCGEGKNRTARDLMVDVCEKPIIYGVLMTVWRAHARDGFR